MPSLSNLSFSSLQNLSPNERRLLMILGMIAFAVINLFLWSYLFQQQRNVSTKLAMLEREIQAANHWLQDEPLYQERVKWVNQKQPTLPNTGEASSQLLKIAQDSAAKYNLSISRNTLGDPEFTPHYTEVTISMNVEGNMQDLVKWFAAIQEHGSFRFFKRLALKEKKDSENLTAETVIALWGKPMQEN